ncbi:hypothetical protein OSB04_000212 [Centaurea solstitialis]|uniref:Zinc-finger domain-containing protein n=1 Tax=Centaurea solstitialis TaxID=347529 RepID=A0AA38WUE9_9ASTR|nr:hypothetical protein OSB04_000212 [Centaurea solstitialis]
MATTMTDKASSQPLEPSSTPVTVNPSDHHPQMDSDYSTPRVSSSSSSSDYEKCREERIKQNLERMQKLGIYDLSLKMRSIKPNAFRKKNNNNENKTPNRCFPPLPSSVPTRRSSRLQNTPAVSYTEAVMSKKGKGENDHLILENSRPEVYTEEHEKLLGDTKTEWTLFVDGYGKDGKKIYDQVRGKTCHQCRQKTLGHRTHCIKCNLVQGQFCGDCLYMRYIPFNTNSFFMYFYYKYGRMYLKQCKIPNGFVQFVAEFVTAVYAVKQKVGLPLISGLGYKSVAHFLIQTRRSDPSSENTEPRVCAKRSLPFSNENVESKDGVETGEKIEPLHDNVELESGQEPENKKLDVGFESGVTKDEKLSELRSSDEPSCNDLKLESGRESEDKNLGVDVGGGEMENLKRVMESDETPCKNVELENGKADNEVENCVVTPKTRSTAQKKRRRVVEPVSENSIAGRLRSRRKCT